MVKYASVLQMTHGKKAVQGNTPNFHVPTDSISRVETPRVPDHPIRQVFVCTALRYTTHDKTVVTLATPV